MNSNIYTNPSPRLTGVAAARSHADYAANAGDSPMLSAHPVPHRWLGLVLWIALCMAVGVVDGALFQPGAWFDGLEKPFFNPPAAVFAPVWTLLYILMGVSAWRVWTLRKSPARRQALRQFLVQLALNALWTPVFFGAQSLAGGLAIIVLLDIAIMVTIQHFHPLDKLAAWLLAPYLAWVTFATALNVALLALNGKFGA